jgi:hypothetical protein
LARQLLCQQQLYIKEIIIGTKGALSAAILYTGNHDRNHNVWNIGSIQTYILHIQVLLKCYYDDFLDIKLLLTKKLPSQGFLGVKLKSPLRKFKGHHHDLVNHYGVSI